MYYQRQNKQMCPDPVFPFFFFKKTTSSARFLFPVCFLAVVGLGAAHGLSLAAVSRGCSFAAGCGPLTVVVSLIVGVGSVTLLHSCSTWAQQLWTRG